MSEVERYWIDPSRLVQEGWHPDDTCVVKDWAYDRVVAERDALQALLTAADERVDGAVNLLEIWRTWFGPTRESCDETGKKIWDRIDAVIAPKPVEGSTCNQIREESGLTINTPCQACGHGACIDR